MRLLKLCKPHLRPCSEAAKAKQHLEMDRLKIVNAENLQMQKDSTAADAALEIKYQQMYTDKLAKQEEQQKESLRKMKEKQQSQEAGIPLHQSTFQPCTSPLFSPPEPFCGGICQ